MKKVQKIKKSKKIRNYEDFKWKKKIMKLIRNMMRKY